MCDYVVNLEDSKGNLFPFTCTAENKREASLRASKHVNKVFKDNDYVIIDIKSDVETLIYMENEDDRNC
jgi:hypothetical protein